MAWLLRPSADPQLLRVVQRLHRPLEMEALPAGLEEVSAAARYRWTAGKIDSDWARARSAGSVTLRSPRLDPALSDELYAILVTLPPATSVGRAVLLWSENPTLSEQDYVRNRRDLVPLINRKSTVEIRGKDIRAKDIGGEASKPVRYLFLHLPAERTGDVVESIAVVTTSDLIAAAPTGRARVLSAGEVRDVVFTRGSQVSYAADLAAHAELSFGIRVPDTATAVRARVTVAANGGQTVLFDRSVKGGAWQDFSVPLPAAAGAVLTFSAGAGRADPPVFWSTPMILGPEDGPARPNVVLYVVDVLRANRLGVYASEGSSHAASPVLDDLGRRGLVFRRAYAAATWTKPSVTSLLTSLYPQTHGLGARYYSDPLPDSAVTLQDALRARGYVTAQFSANSLAGTLSNLDKGFDWSFMPEAFGAARKPGAAHKIDAHQLNARILPWLDAHARQRFFLYIHSVDAHPPFIAPEAGGAADPLAAYDAAVAFNDREIGNLYRRLVDLHLASRTLFIVTADHGEAFGEHGQRGHGVSVYEEEARVPLIVHWPGTVSAGRIEEPVSLVDVMPTILDYCSIPAGGAVQGRSLRPHAGTVGPSAPVFVTRFVYPEDLDAASADRVESHAVVAFPWKLIATDAEGGPRFELYDLDADPREQHDLASAEPERVKGLNAVLEGFLGRQARTRTRFLAEHGAPGSAPGADTKSRRLPSAEIIEQLRSLGYLR